MIPVFSFSFRRWPAAIVVALVAAVEVSATPPEWWTAPATSIIAPDAVENNYAPANLGQLKHLATQARKHLDASLPGGAGSTVIALVEAFTDDPATNFSPINLGQLKAVAKPFYDRLLSAGYDTNASLIAHGYPASWTSNYPWDPATPVSANYAPANLGQLKLVFSFDMGNFDSDEDGLPDVWEQQIIDADPNDAITSTADVQPADDFDGDGLDNAREYQIGSDPTDAGSGLEAALLGRWTFDEGTGTTAGDSSGGGHDGTLSPGVTWGEDPWGRKYVNLPGGQEALTIPAADLLVGADDRDFTVAFRVKINAAPTAAWHQLIRKGNGDSERTFALWLVPNSNQIHARISSAADFNMGIDSSNASLPVGQWTHLSYVKEGSELRLYINGQLDTSAALPYPVTANTGPIVIGQQFHEGAVASYDDVEIYDLALNAGEIASLQSTNGSAEPDNLDDAWEIQYFGDATIYGDNDDPDQDGASNLEEYQAGRTPNKKDHPAVGLILFLSLDPQ